MDPTQALTAYVKLNRATRAVLGAVEPRLLAHDLTLTQLGVLEAILHLGPLTQRDLARKVLTSPANLTDLLTKLATRGLIQREPVPTDRRTTRIRLTPQGDAFIRALFPLHAADIARTFACLDARELAELDRLLRKLGLGAATLELPEPRR